MIPCQGQYDVLIPVNTLQSRILQDDLPAKSRCKLIGYPKRKFDSSRKIRKLSEDQMEILLQSDKQKSFQVILSIQRGSTTYRAPLLLYGDRFLRVNM